MLMASQLADQLTANAGNFSHSDRKGAMLPVRHTNGLGKDEPLMKALRLHMIAALL